jgi:hypothetical protein
MVHNLVADAILSYLDPTFLHSSIRPFLSVMLSKYNHGGEQIKEPPDDVVTLRSTASPRAMSPRGNLAGGIKNSRGSAGLGTLAYTSMSSSSSTSVCSSSCSSDSTGTNHMRTPSSPTSGNFSWSTSSDTSSSRKNVLSNSKAAGVPTTSNGDFHGLVCAGKSNTVGLVGESMEEAKTVVPKVEPESARRPDPVFAMVDTSPRANPLSSQYKYAHQSQVFFTKFQDSQPVHPASFSTLKKEEGRKGAAHAPARPTRPKRRAPVDPDEELLLNEIEAVSFICGCSFQSLFPSI